MMLLSYIALFAWVPAVVFLFTVMRPHHAAITAVIFGWLFLPLLAIERIGLPALDKASATMAGILLGTALFAPNQFLGLRPRWFDIPMAAWIIAPFLSAVHFNGDVYDGATAAFDHLVLWGLPYLIGRIYLTNYTAFRDVAVGLVIGAMTYIPFAIWEMRMSPQLHAKIYGVPARTNWESWGFVPLLQWKPTVFMDTPFSVTMLMGMAALVALVMSRWRIGQRALGVPLGPLAGVLVVMTVMCKVWSGILMMGTGVGVMLLSRTFNTRVLLIALLLVPPLYMVSRAAGRWSGEPVPALVAQLSERRADSFSVRLRHERMLADRAMQRPIFGWGGWGRWRVTDDRGRDVTRSDGLWVITLGRTGIFGLTSLTLILLLPLGMFVYKVPPALWNDPAAALMMAFALMPALHMIDNLPNAFPNPLFYMVAGGMMTWLAALPRPDTGAAPVTAGPGASLGRPGA